MSNIVFANIQSGTLLDDGEHAAITVEVAGVPISFAIPTLEVTSLLTLCVVLAGQAAAVRPGDELQVLEVDDWDVGRTSSGALIVRLQSDNGASLMYRLTAQQGLGLRDAITRATAASAAPADRAPSSLKPSSPETGGDLAALLALGEACRGNPVASRTIDGCLALLAEIDAANDEGRAVYRENLSALLAAATERFASGNVSANEEQPA